MADTFLLRLRKRVRPRHRVRLLWRRVNPRRNRLPPILVNGFPKSGTHMLQRCVALLPGTNGYNEERCPNTSIHRETPPP